MASDTVVTSPPPTRPWPDALRLLAFVLSVMVLFLLARQGQSQPVMYAAFAAFLVAATLWVRGLDDNWIEGRQDFRSPWLLAGVLALAAAGTVAVAIGVDDSRSTYVLGALIMFYIGLGLAIRRMRWWVINGPQSAAAMPRWERLGVWLVERMLHWQVPVALLVAAYVGFWLLGGSLMPLALVLLLAVVPLPAAVHVLSERRVIVLSAPSMDDRRRVWVLGGLAMVVTGLAIAAWIAQHQTFYVFAVVVALAVLAWALAVGSLADIAVVLAVLALMGVTPGSQDVKPAVLSAPAAGASQKVVVALGDSYSSGEGASRYLDKTNVAGGDQCRRAATAWPVLVAQSVGADRLVFRACSGARARNLVGVLADDEQYAGEGIQVDRAAQDVGTALTVPPALIVLSIGGNDAGFRQIGSSCLSMRSCDTPELSHLFYDNLARVEPALRATYAAIARKFPETPIAVMPYPDAFATDDGCVRAPVEEGDIRFVRAFTARLDGIIEKTAAEEGLYYVAPMRSALTESHLALCDPSNTPGLNFLDFRGVGGAALDRFNPGNWIHDSLHPNERGHAALAAAFIGWLSSQRRVDGHGDELTGLAALLPAAAHRPGGAAAPHPELPVPTRSTTTLCFEKGRGDCGHRADDWALRQLGPGTVRVVLLAGWTALGAWLLAVGASAQRFRRRLPAA